MIRPPPSSTLSPYTTLFRSQEVSGHPIERRGTVHGVAPTASVDVHVQDWKSTRLNSSHQIISYAVFCLKKKNEKEERLSLDYAVGTIHSVSNSRSALIMSRM